MRAAYHVGLSRSVLVFVRDRVNEISLRNYLNQPRRYHQLKSLISQSHPISISSDRSAPGRTKTVTTGASGYHSSISVPAQTNHMSAVDQKLESELAALRLIVPELNPGKHKGQAGKIAVIGGCKEYTGAPYFAAISALKIGADLSHVMCSKEAGPVIKSYSPELIVHPIMRESWEIKVSGDSERGEVVNGVLAEVSKWLPRFDCLVIGPGLGRDPLLMECVSEVIRDARKANIPMVIDGDGLSIVTSHPALLHGYPYAILTPNVNEHRRLVAALVGEEGTRGTLPEQLQMLAQKLGGVTIVQKGPTDHISDGKRAVECSVVGSPRRCGGQGDILAGSIAVFMGWARAYVASDPSEESLHTFGKGGLSQNPGVLAAYAGCLLVRKAAEAAFERRKRSTLTTDIIEELGGSMDELFPLGDIIRS